MRFTLYQFRSSRNNIIGQQAGDASLHGHCPVTYEWTKPQWIIRIHAVLHWEMTKISRLKATDHTRILMLAWPRKFLRYRAWIYLPRIYRKGLKMLQNNMSEVWYYLSDLCVYIFTIAKESMSFPTDIWNHWDI